MHKHRIWYKSIAFILPGFVFGVILLKSEVVSWYRIYEMFHFRSFHMYGVMASAVLVAASTLFLMKKLGAKTYGGESVVTKPSPFAWKRNLAGGLLFGLGWALGGACPGPIFALSGYMQHPYLILFAGSIIGVLLYGYVRNWVDKVE